MALVISAPFGNHDLFAYEGAIRTRGTFTLDRRGGRLWRLWRIAWTLRYHRALKAWTNKLGLPNPGIDESPFDLDAYGSIHGFNLYDWDLMLLKAYNRYKRVELNLSCPNVHQQEMKTLVTVGGTYVERLGVDYIIAKLSPVYTMELGEQLYDVGVRHFHLCNTFPVPCGGMSGKPLKQLSLRAVELFRNKWPDVHLIGGGGVTGIADARDYLSAGANDVAIATMLLNPMNWHKARDMAIALAK